MGEDKTEIFDMPSVTTLSKLYYADDEQATNKQRICLCEEIPALEEPPEQVTGSAVDIDYEFSRPGKKKAGTVEVPVFYTYTQHKRLKGIERKDKWFFVEYPEESVPEGEKPLIKKFRGCIALVGDTLTQDEWIKDKVTIYRSSEVNEIYGFPTTTPLSGS